MSLFSSLPWDRITELAARALIAWEPPRSGLPKVQEECGEIVTAVNQFNYGRIDASELARELVDGLLMIVQGAQIVGDKIFHEAFQEKFSRLGSRLQKHSEGCPVCDGKGEVNGNRCFNCYAPMSHEDTCAIREGRGAACDCRNGLLRRITELGCSGLEYKTALEPPDDAWLEEVFRDFAPETGVEEWRRRVYARCIAHHAMKVEVLHG